MIEVLYPAFSYCALDLLISPDGLVKWTIVKKIRPSITWSAFKPTIVLKWNVDGSSPGKPAVVKALELTSSREDMLNLSLQIWYIGCLPRQALTILLLKNTKSLKPDSNASITSYGMSFMVVIRE
ncbi:hypothetical protein NC652_015420 [Populus alba x Populus x berolinensis]|nr:hypothetical protein NC652_015420 [Populus alba x Populus x berolinensis]